MEVEPYLNFDGRCEEAIAFYQRALDAKVMMLLRYGERPNPAGSTMTPAGYENKVMHAAFRVGRSVIKATDGNCKGQPRFEGITLSLAVDGASEGERLFLSLADEGRVNLPFAKSFFSKGFGIVADRFGVNWMIVVQD